MNKPQYHFIFFIICCFLISSTGCSLNINESSSEDTASTSSLRIMLKMGDAFASEDNAYINSLEQELNIDIEIESPAPSSYNERLNVMMAVGNMPDIVQLNWTGEANFPMWVQQKLILPIDLSSAPNIEMNVPDALLAMMKVSDDGQVYGIPGITTSYPYGVAVRQDWLDTLGLDTPRTLDEFIYILEQFTNADPDNNGKNDTVGITSWRLNHFGGVFGGAFQIDYLWNSLHSDAGDNSGKVKLREEQNGYTQFLDFTRDIYRTGYLDKSFTSLQNAEDKFVLGKVGMIGSYSCDVIKLELQLKKAVPDASLNWILSPGDYEGRVWNFVPEAYGYNGAGSMFGDNAIFLITKNADYDAALYFLDQMNSQKFILLSNLGIRGIHYETFDSNRSILVRTSEQNEAVMRDLFGISDTYRNESHAYLGNNEDENARLEYYRKKGYLLITNPSSYNTGMVSEMTEFQKTYPGYRDSERSLAIKYITGEITQEEHIQYLKQELSAQKDILSDALNDKYSKLTSTALIK